MPKKVTIVIDLQFGSTGKGLIAGYLAKRNNFDTVITTWGPNAGHTFIDEHGVKHVHTMLANAIVSPKIKTVMIGPGSMINPESLLSEIMHSPKEMDGKTLMIHPHAGVVMECHREEESGPMTKIGSTKKGCGAALKQRIERNPDNMNIAKVALEGHPLHSFVVSIKEWNQTLVEAKEILLEMAQGFSLSIYHGFYPYCTSRDVTPAQGMADAGLPLSWLKKTIGCLRTLPIRVANRFNENGEQIGYSGPCYSDQVELDWGLDLNLVPELTTVTKLPRRIFTFSFQQLKEALLICEPDEIFLNFMNYLSLDEQVVLVRNINQTCESILHSEYKHPTVKYVGFGPQENHVFDTTLVGLKLERFLSACAVQVKVDGVEEGDPCPEEGCDGIMEYGEVEGCNCHNSPPCNACVTNPLTCSKCGYEVEQ